MKRIDGLEKSLKRIDENQSANVNRLEAVEGVMPRVEELEVNIKQIDVLE